MPLSEGEAWDLEHTERKRWPLMESAGKSSPATVVATSHLSRGVEGKIHQVSMRMAEEAVGRFEV